MGEEEYMRLGREGKREWKRPWYAAIGGGYDQELGICCLGFTMPCFLFGWNRTRAFGVSGLKWGAITGASFLLAAFLLYLIVAFEHLTYTVDTLKRNMYSRHCQPHYDSGEYSDYCPDLEYFLNVMPLLPVLFAALVGYIILFAFGWWNRAQLRNKYDLPGNHCTDCLLWGFCSPCAVSQEAHTLASNNVIDGVWIGPGKLVVAQQEV